MTKEQPTMEYVEEKRKEIASLDNGNDLHTASNLLLLNLFKILTVAVDQKDDQLISELSKGCSDLFLQARFLLDAIEDNVQ